MYSSRLYAIVLGVSIWCLLCSAFPSAGAFASSRGEDNYDGVNLIRANMAYELLVFEIEDFLFPNGEEIEGNF